MKRKKRSETGSFLKSVLRALGMDKGSASPSLSHAETKPSGSMSYVPHGFTRNALLEAEQAKAMAITEAQKRHWKIC